MTTTRKYLVIVTILTTIAAYDLFAKPISVPKVIMYGAARQMDQKEPQRPTELTGICTLVSDGDTVVIKDTDGKLAKIRLAEIDCPESKQPFGDIANDMCAALVLEQAVRVEITGYDKKWDRYVGTVYCGHKLSVNELLLRAGLAWHYKQYSNNERYANLQKDAQRDGKGLWSVQPIEPRIYRKGK